MPNCRPVITAALVLSLLVVGTEAVRTQTLPDAAKHGQGEQLFGRNCAPCHGLDAHGGEHAPNIATDERVQSLTDADLQRTLHTGIPGAGMPGFAKILSPDQINSVIAYLRTLQRNEDPSGTNGNVEAGQHIFMGKTARCSECHKMNATGGLLGADLTGWGRSHSGAQLRQVLENQSEIPEEKLALVTATSQGGNRLVGIIRNQDNFTLQLQLLDGRYALLRRSTLASLSIDKTALLHKQYVGKLSASDLADLSAFILQKDKDAKEAEEKSAPDEEEQ